MSEMETVNFYPKYFHEIEHQDNPAFGDDPCLMIVGEPATGRARAVVLRIEPDPIESVNHVAVFWKEDDAVDYCLCLGEDRPHYGLWESGKIFKQTQDHIATCPLCKGEDDE